MADEETRVVRRIKAKTSDKPKKEVTKIKKVKAVAPETKSKKTKKTKADNYFVGAWHELKQVHWTNRRGTWKLTIAVLLFSGFFALFILIADWIFNWLIQEVLL